MSSEIITKNDLKAILDTALPARANTTITTVTLPYTPPCNGLFLGMLGAEAQGRAYKQFSNIEPSLWDFYQVANGYSVFASFAKAGIQIAQTATSNVTSEVYYFFVPLDGTSPLFSGNADAVVVQGTDGIWTYRKWNSGISECWGKWTGTLAAGSAVFGGYQYNTDLISYPTNLFIEEPNADTSGRIGSGHCLTGTLYQASASSIKVWAISQVSGTQDCTFFIRAIGKWK